MGGSGVGESEEEFRAALLEEYKGATDLVIEEVEYVSSVSELIAQQQQEIAEEELETIKPTIN